MKAASQGGREPRLPRPGPKRLAPSRPAAHTRPFGGQEGSPGAEAGGPRGYDHDSSVSLRGRCGDPASLAAHLPHLPARSGSEAPFQRPTGGGGGVVRDAQISRGPYSEQGGCAEAESRAQPAAVPRRARPRAGPKRGPASRARAPRLAPGLGRPPPRRPRPALTQDAAGGSLLPAGGRWGRRPRVLAPVPSSPRGDTNHPRLPRDVLATTPTIF
ncbi:unnamed protein product [Rangifer tarandus platyrhynchus]|uniref:Uncharacterized protein n=1 Tax=Rangifer tarandus platyrhynchus TaxID=3082113 RepID=A0ABN9A075_RANTA|nr:unnamed protein product [Rangifer tarandus platyrhynchus]